MNGSKLSDKAFALVPAAGMGRRMGANLPKQYLPLLGKTILEHTIQTLLNMPPIQSVVVALAPDDNAWQSMLVFQDPRVVTVDGGTERSHSVLNGLHTLAKVCDSNDWVLVHDVARPCISLDTIYQMFHELADDDVGGILAVSCNDTIKRVQDGKIIDTVDRNLLWQAQTPQMFRFELLHRSLTAALDKNLLITDEASAMEAAGYRPRIVEGSRRNIKITTPEDLSLAEFYLQKSVSTCV